MTRDICTTCAASTARATRPRIFDSITISASIAT
jgi:hypothetical protein